MQVYSGWPQLVRCELYHLVRGHFRILQREKGGLRIHRLEREATPRARHPLCQASAEKPDQNLSSGPEQSFQLVGPRSPQRLLRSCRGRERTMLREAPTATEIRIYN